MNIDENDYIDLETTVHELLFNELSTNALLYSNPNFKEGLISELVELFYECWNDTICDIESIDSLISEYVTSFFDIYQEFPLRSYEELEYTFNKSELEDQIEILRKYPQPKQKTMEWYENRHNMITASNMWKIFSTESQVNSMIYDKCKPFDPSHRIMSASVTWGNVFEPVSIQIYEDKYKTTIEDFGCISHPSIDFIGASPDGINVDPNSDKYGRMLEVKNIYNRDINGIPKEEYWIQMQIQLETCNLEYCDFLETRFLEYNHEKDFYNGTHEYKGIILYFMKDKSNDVKHVYMPLSLKSQEEIDNWKHNIQLNMDSEYKLTRINYWYLDELSCVVVKRNHKWFEIAKEKIIEIWNIIQKEKKEGFTHREPKKKIKPKTNIFVSQMDSSQIIHNLKIDNKINLIKLK